MSILLLAVLTLVAGVSPAAAFEGDPAAQVVELFVTHQEYDARMPWAKPAPDVRSALAMVVDGPRLLTTAQMVDGAILVQAQKRGGPAKVPARIVHADWEVNLAVLAVDEPGFFADLVPVRLAGDLGSADTPLKTVRWRQGQLEISNTRPARFEVRQPHGANLDLAVLMVKNDLAGGGWAEPVFAGDALAGLSVAQDEDQAWVLPVATIGRYLEAVKTGDYAGFAPLGITWQPNRDPALAAHLGLSGEPRGVVVLAVPHGTSAEGILMPRDVLLSLDGHAIDSEGYYQHPRYGRILFPAIATDGHQAGDRLAAEILRDGRIEAVTIPLICHPTWARLVPRWPDIHPPPYLVLGGLVFQELDGSFLAIWGKNWSQEADPRLLAYWDLEREAQTPERRRIVLLSYVLPSPYTIGYQALRFLAVRSVNGRPVDTIASLAAALAAPEGSYHRIVFAPNPARDELVLDAAAEPAATAAVLAAYNIPERLRLSSPVDAELEPRCP
ncbi:MAG: hypothetical protein AB1634_14105 [Thermodesulfobacteriota bacterium]